MQDSRVFMQPFETSNHSKINKKKVAPKERIEIQVGDELFFGNDGPYKLIEETGTILPPAVVNTTAQSKINRPGTATPNSIPRKPEERINLTSPDAKFWVDQKIKSRLTEEGIISKHANKLKEVESKKARLEDLNNRRVLLEEKIRIMKHKSDELTGQLTNIRDIKKRQESEIALGKDTFTSTGSYQKALEGFAAEVQRKIGTMQIALAEKNQVLKELAKKEFIRQYEKESKAVQDLRDKFVALQSDIELQRSRLRGRRLDGEEGGHLSSIVEQQYEELGLARRQLLEHEARETTSQQRWNKMLQENLQKEEKVRGLKLQIERNLDNVQLLLMDHDTRTFDLAKKVYELLGLCAQEQQRDAAFFLTQQLPLVQEERREILMENEQFHLSNQETINDIEQTKSQLDRLKLLIDHSLDLDTASQNQVLAHFKERLDLVHDRVEQEKNGEKVSILSDLRAELESMEMLTAKESARKNQLQNRLSEYSSF